MESNQERRCPGEHSGKAATTHPSDATRKVYALASLAATHSATAAVNRFTSARCRSVTVVIAGTLALSACGNGGTNNAASRETDRSATIRIAFDAVPSSFDPIKVIDNNGLPTLTALYDQLFQLDDKLEIAPMLVTKWSFSDGGRTLTLTLRDDVVFNGSGRTLDAQAVKLSLERAKSETGSLVSGLLASLTSVNVLDATTVSLHFSTPSYGFPATVVSDVRIGSIVDPTFLKDSALASQPQGSGPYILKSATQSEIVMTRVASHWDKTSGLAATINLIAIADGNARMNGIRAGQVDLTYTNFAQLEVAKKLAASGQYQLRYGETKGKYILRMNPMRLPDPRVRKAINMALDRAAFCSSQYPNLGEPSRQVFVKGNDGYDARFDQDIAADPIGAMSLLQEASQSRLTISLLGVATAKDRLEIVQQQLAMAGITVKVTIVATVVSLSTEYRTGKYDALLHAYTGTVDSASIIDQNLNNPPGFGVPDYLSSALAAANSAAPGDDRDAAFHKVNEILIDKPVDAPMCSTTQALIGTSRVVGIADVKYISYTPPHEVRRLGLTR